MEKTLKGSLRNTQMLDFKIPPPPEHDEPDELAEAITYGLKKSNELGGNANSQGVVAVAKRIIAYNVTGLAKRPKNLLMLMGIFTVLWTFLGMAQPRGFTSLLIFLTGSYNNFLGKFLVFLGFVDIIIPAGKALKENRFEDYLNPFKVGLKSIKKAYKTLGSQATSLFFISSGFGIAVSNLLTRNNKIDKYFVCIITALMLMQAIGSRRKNNLFAIGQGIIADVIKLTKKKNVPMMDLTHLLFGGFSGGLVVSIAVPFLGNTQYSDPKGYIVGAVIMIIGLGLYFTTSKGVKKQNG